MLTLSVLYRHHHFASMAMFVSFNDPIPIPPNSFGFVTLHHATQLILCCSVEPPHKNSLLRRSNS
ncbi:hypothetical protein HanRHA438_Chr10g0474511 [Helianthus annuus]|nr:hypothetical protein HanIR_Chr10g0497951 [Helianthus annuus]KAJ0881457.1 hypothetical protein HanRHA438_Chr10g0474511 [Helianthus annuus]